MSEDRIAALDCQWSSFTPAEQAAFDMARRLTHEPHKIEAAHLDRLRKHYKDLQVLEILFTVAGNNAMTRWTDGMGIPQEENGSAFARGTEKRSEVLRTFLTPTSEVFRNKPSQVVPDRSVPLAERRPPLESRAAAEEALAACRKRTPRLPLVDAATARDLLPADWPKGPLPQWVRLLANFPRSGKGRILGLRAAAEKGTLDKTLRAKMAWIAARNDRAWYALGHARQRLLAMGLSEDAIWALDGPWDRCSAKERAVFELTRKITIAADLITDRDVAEVRKHFSDREVAEVVYQITVTAFFDRLTEASGLQLER